MPDIYKLAKRVVVWLGKGSRATGTCFTWLHRISKLNDLTMITQISDILAKRMKKIDVSEL